MNLICLRFLVVCLLICSGFLASLPCANAQVLATINETELQARINEIVIPKLQTLKVPGYSLAVIYKGQVIFQQCYGYQNPETQKRVMPETVFGLASLTKTFTGLALLVLVDQGKVRIEDTLDQYIDNLPPAWKKIRIGQLATMTAGMRKGIPHELPWPEEMRKLEAMPLLSAPGMQAVYSNPSYRLLGSVIERASGLPYLSFVRQTILGPLRMETTGTTVDFIDRGILAVPFHYDKQSDSIRLVQYKEPAISFSAGMLASNILDLTKYVQGLFNRQIISQSGYDLLWFKRPFLGPNKPVNWAYGWGSKANAGFAGQRTIGMNGGDPGVSSSVFLIPDKQFAVIALANVNGAKAVYQIPHLVAKAVLAQLREGSARPSFGSTCSQDPDIQPDQ